MSLYAKRLSGQDQVNQNMLKVRWQLKAEIVKETILKLLIFEAVFLWTVVSKNVYIANYFASHQVFCVLLSFDIWFHVLLL